VPRRPGPHQAATRGAPHLVPPASSSRPSTTTISAAAPHRRVSRSTYTCTSDRAKSPTPSSTTSREGWPAGDEPRRHDAAFAIIELAFGDPDTTEAGLQALHETVKPHDIGGELHWDFHALADGARASHFVLASHLAEAWSCELAEVLGALRAEIEGAAVPSDLGELEAVWGKPPTPLTSLD
jgi:hypothetical protein